MPKIIKAENLTYTYLPGSVYEHQALRNITFSLEQGEFLGIFGPNGSGKSTLAQHFNGLIQATGGFLQVCGLDTTDTKTRKVLWQKVGLCFQYPEQQIFQATVYNEVAYGPRNLGLKETEIQTKVLDALHLVGLPSETRLLAPASLSGGMRRKVAIASILAIQPEILILDEPMAGLDPAGRKLILNIIEKRQMNNKTTVMISHNLKEIMTLTDKIMILDQGSLIFFGDIQDLVAKPEILDRYRLDLPEYLQIMLALSDKGYKVKTEVGSLKEAADEILRLLS